MGMADTVDVLIIDRSEDDAFLAMRVLSRAGLNPRPLRVETPRELGAALVAGTWDLVLCDGLYPMLGLADVVAAVHDALPRTPVVVFSSRVPDVARISERMGVAGVVTKEALQRLPVVVRSALAARRGRDALRRIA
jgi:DNA-binding NtrC family response regulator